MDLKIIVPRSTSTDEVIFLVDVCMFNIGCPTHMVKSEEELKDLFVKQENKKLGQYAHVGLLNDTRLIPFIVDVCGNLGEKALKFLSDLAWLSYPSDLLSKKFVRGFIDSLQFVINESLSNQAINYQSWIETKLRNAKEVNNFFGSNPICSTVQRNLLSLQ